MQKENEGRFKTFEFGMRSRAQRMQALARAQHVHDQKNHQQRDEETVQEKNEYEGTTTARSHVQSQMQVVGDDFGEKMPTMGVSLASLPHTLKSNRTTMAPRIETSLFPPICGKRPIEDKQTEQENCNSKKLKSVSPLAEQDLECEMARILDNSCNGKSGMFRQAFEAEWKNQMVLIKTAQKATRGAFAKQVTEESNREKMAKQTWEYQMEKLQQRIDTMTEQLESTKEEIEEYEQMIKRFTGDAESAVDMNIDELHSMVAMLLSTASKVRKQKDRVFGMELSNRTDAMLCILCQERPKSVVVNPCHHFALCKLCNDRLPKRQCPVCRTRIQSAIRVIVP